MNRLTTKYPGGMDLFGAPTVTSYNLDLQTAKGRIKASCALGRLEDIIYDSAGNPRITLERLRDLVDAERENLKPLNLGELRQMNGEPVWVDDWIEDFHGWELSANALDYFDDRDIEQYGSRWIAYRHKPTNTDREGLLESSQAKISTRRCRLLYERDDRLPVEYTGVTHYLKLKQQYYDASADGHKTFEIRKDDRNYSVGDILYLYAWDGIQQGPAHYKQITYALRDTPYVPEGYVCLGVLPISVEAVVEASYEWRSGHDGDYEEKTYDCPDYEPETTEETEDEDE